MGVYSVDKVEVVRLKECLSFVTVIQSYDTSENGYQLIMDSYLINMI